MSKLVLNKEFDDGNKYGYICYKDIEGEYNETLYSSINNKIIYDFINKEKNIHKENFKYMVPSLEFYIDKTIFKKKFNCNNYPRIIFPLQ